MATYLWGKLMFFYRSWPRAPNGGSLYGLKWFIFLGFSFSNRPFMVSFLWTLTWGKEDAFSFSPMASVLDLLKTLTTSSSSVFVFFFYLWNWISSTLQTPLNLHSLENLLYILKQHVSPQLRSIRLVAIIFVIWGIWHCRDKQRFNNVVIPLHNIKIMISSFISLVGNSDLGTMGRSIDELCVFKAFNIARNLTQALLHHSSAS